MKNTIFIIYAQVYFYIFIYIKLQHIIYFSIHTELTSCYQSYRATKNLQKSAEEYYKKQN